MEDILEEYIQLLEEGNEYQVINESSEVDGEYILAKVRGPAFFPETTSRNSVHYPLAAWVNAINFPDFKRKLKDRLVYGTIGHKIKLDDAAVRDGKVSHIVSDVFINENNVGIAEYLILNTEPGRILNTLLRAGSKLRVSTKAAGKFSSTGKKSVDPSRFFLDRIDFVLDPGYLEALPEVLESYNNFIENSEDTPEMEENSKLIQFLESQVADLTSQVTTLNTQLETVRNNFGAIEESANSYSDQLKSYTSLGTVESIEESLSLNDQYKDLGSPKEIEEALDAADALTDKMSAMMVEKDVSISEALDQVNFLTDINEQYKELGSPEEISESLDKAIDLVDKITEIGTLPEIQEALENADKISEIVEQYQELGTVDEIGQALDIVESMIEDKKLEKVSTIATKHGIDESVVTDQLEKGATFEQIESICESLSSNRKPPAQGAPNRGVSTKRYQNNDNVSIEESRDTKLSFTGSLIDNLTS